MKHEKEICPTRLRQFFCYNKKTGKITRRFVKPWMCANGKDGQEKNANKINKRLAGSDAFFTLHENGYLVGNFEGKLHRAHRIAWVLHWGKWPDGDIDHINGDRTDNRIENLRCVTRSENLLMRKMSRRNTSGVQGVSFEKGRGKWNAYFDYCGVRKNLGYFDTLEEASRARFAAEESVCKELMGDDVFKLKRAILAAQGVKIVLS